MKLAIAWRKSYHKFPAPFLKKNWDTKCGASVRSQEHSLFPPRSDSHYTIIVLIISTSTIFMVHKALFYLHKGYVTEDFVLSTFLQMALSFQGVIWII